MKPGQFGGKDIADFDGPAFGMAPVKAEGAPAAVDPGAKGRKSRAAPMIELYLPSHDVKTMLVAVNMAHKVADRKRQLGEMRKFAKVRKYLEHMLSEAHWT